MLVFTVRQSDICNGPSILEADHFPDLEEIQLALECVQQKILVPLKLLWE